MAKKLREPCMDPNPWPKESWVPNNGQYDRPCGRPKGHDLKGGGGAQWGGGHAEHPSDDDPPTKPVVLKRQWVADDPPPTITIRNLPDGEEMQVRVGRKVLITADHDTDGWGGIERLPEAVKAIAKEFGIEVEER
jgi:hypothetical protein